MSQSEAPTIHRRTVTLPDGTTEIVPSVVRAAWTDPDDKNPLRREAREVDGFRTFDAMAAMHKQNPATWTEAHVIAADRFRRDYEIGIEGASQNGAGGTAAWSTDGRMVARVDTATAYREAMDALGYSMGWMVRRLVLQNWTLTDLAAHYGTTRNRVSGRVEAALTRLVEHYDGGRNT